MLVVRCSLFGHQPTAPCPSASSGNLPHHEDLLDAIPANVYGPPKRNAADHAGICPIFQTHHSQIPNPESRISVWRMPSIGHPMSHPGG